MNIMEIVVISHISGDHVKRLFSKRSNQFDLPAQKVLYNQFYKTVYKTAFRYCGETSATLDIVQETFVRAFTYISTYKEEKNGSFEGWLVTIARNESFKYLKSKWKCNEIPTEEIIEVASQNSIDSLENQVIDRIGVEEIIHIIEQLAPHYHQVILLRLLHDHSFKEIGEIVDISENTARQTFYRAKKAVIVLLQEKWSGINEE